MTKSRTRGLWAWWAALAPAVFALLSGQGPPRDAGLTERVEVREVQIAVTAWPRSGEPAACQLLRKEDLLLEVNGVATPIVALTPLASTSVEVPSQAPAAPQAPGGAPMQFVILIDEFHHSCPTCAAREACDGLPPHEHLVARHEAYESARRMLRAEFQVGDRILVAPFLFWPMAETGWLDDREHAIAELDRLERDGEWVGWHHARAHMKDWFSGMVTFMRTLGQVPGVKDVFFPACHFQLSGDNAEDLRELAAAAAENDVVLHTVDLINYCAQVGDAIGPLASNLAGRRYTAAQGMAGAAGELRRMAGCRFLVSFKPASAGNQRIGNSVKVSSRNPDFEMQAPQAFFGPGRVATPEQARQGLFLLPEFRKHFALEASILPLGPDKQSKKRWEALAVVHAQRLPEEIDRPAPERLILDVIVWRRGAKPQTFERRIEGRDLDRLLEARDGRSFTFRVTAPAEKSFITAILHDDRARAESSAVVRRRIVLPDARDASKNGLWLLAKRPVRHRGEVYWLPELDETYEPGEQPVILAYGCRGSGESAPRPHGRFVREGPGAADEVEVGFEPHRGRLLDALLAKDCGWSLGASRRPLAAGDWRFEPAGSSFPESLRLRVQAPIPKRLP